MTEPTTNLVIPELLRLRAAHHPDRIALNVDGRDTITYADWERRVNGVARGLIERGVARGRRIALLYSGMDWLEYAVAYLSVLNAGGTAVHLNDGLPEAEINRRLAQCAVSGIVRGQDVRPPAGFTSWVTTVSDVDTGVTAPVPLTIGIDDISDILYTSGSTGPAKAFTAPHGNLTFGRGPEGFRNFGDPTPLIVPMPLGTTSSATTVGVSLTSPATLILSPVDDVERMGELIGSFRIGSVMITPWIALQMVQARVPERYDFSCVRTLATASAPFPPALARRLLSMIPNAELTSAYSESEAVPAVVVDTFDPDRPMSVGKPAPSTELRVADDNGDPVPVGQLGEVWLRCGAPKRLYLDNQQLNQEVHAGGWTRTRDLAYIGEDGYLYLFDRRKDAARVNGSLVSSIWVEAAIYEHPAVREAAVISLPADGGGHRIAAVVALEQPDALGDLEAFLAGRLAPHEVPSQFLVLDRLPRSQNGKVLKQELRERLSAPGADAGTAAGTARPAERKERDGVAARATSSFTIDDANEQPYDERDGAVLSRTKLTKTFSGDLEGTSTAETLMARSQVEGSQAYVGFERIEGALHGRKGSFVLQHAASGSKAGFTGSWTIVPDSGTGELQGIRGTGQIAPSPDGGHQQFTLDYELG